MPRCDTFCIMCKGKTALYVQVSDDDEGTTATMSKILFQHFGIEVDQFNQICFKCWSITDSFHNLYEQVHHNECKLIRTAQCLDARRLSEETVKPTSQDDEQNPHQFERVLIKEGPASDDDDDVVDETWTAQRSSAFDREDEKPAAHRHSPPASDYELNITDYNVIESNVNDAEEDQSSTDDRRDDGDARQFVHPNPDIELANRQIREYFSMRCELCPQTFATIKQAFGHYRQQHQRTGYIRCCDKKFFRRYVALRHVQAHLNPKLCECEPCNKSFASQEALHAHNKVHHSGTTPSFGCDLCAKQFARAYHLLVHKRLVHTERSDEMFGCDICGKFFDYKHKLAVHMRKSHSHMEKHICHICAKDFSSRNVLNLHHRRTHTDLPPEPRLNCNICNKLLANKYSLGKHMKRHTTDVSTCEFCGKTFTNSVRLNAHMRYLHSGRTFKCTMCPKKFKCNMSLRDHVATHAGNRLYTCNYCPKTFIFAGSKSKHHKTSHFKEWSHSRAQQYSASSSVVQTNDSINAAED